MHFVFTKIITAFVNKGTCITDQKHKCKSWQHRKKGGRSTDYLKELQDKGMVGYTDDTPNPKYRQLLVKSSFIREVAKDGMSTNPS